MVLVLAANGPASTQTEGTSDPGRALVVVNGTPITAGDLEFMMLSRKVPQERREAERPRLLEQLIDRQLLAEYLAEHKAVADPVLLRRQIEHVELLIRKAGDDPATVLARLGYTRERLERDLALPLAWRAQFAKGLTLDSLRRYWAEHREQFDGTQRRISQIMLRAEDEPSRREAREKLSALRKQIQEGELSFEETAAAHSESPSGERGGDLGFYVYRGALPAALLEAAFALEGNAVSEPIDTPLGVHLVKVTEHRPGQLSLEDVRRQVFEQMADEALVERLKQARADARIQWKESALAD